VRVVDANFLAVKGIIAICILIDNSAATYSRFCLVRVVRALIKTVDKIVAITIELTRNNLSFRSYSSGDRRRRRRIQLPSARINSGLVQVALQRGTWGANECGLGTVSFTEQVLKFSTSRIHLIKGASVKAVDDTITISIVGILWSTRALIPAVHSTITI
jgi:hypothetical protein